MFRLVHLSDPHIGPLPMPTFSELASKRVIGYINWRRNRAPSMRGDLLLRMITDIRSRNADHVAVTGDLVNIALRSELEPARAFLDSIGDPRDVSVVPGNHDAYVPGALLRATVAWAPYMTGDDAHSPAWPYVRRREGIAIVGTSSARASGPFLATGFFSDKQEDLLRDRLEMLRREGLFRVVLIHHPPFSGATAWHKRLVGASRVRRVLKSVGAELVLHGHTHMPTRTTMPGPDGPVPVIGVCAASQEHGGRRPASGYNVFEIEKVESGVWKVLQIDYRVSLESGNFVEFGRHETLIGGEAGSSGQPAILNQA
ncbi:metallophosphoesterase family protein [Methylobrevis pamukkalensis]|uniref:Calcineurin-like phosphoesterase n=1 Tax=Methylobrevis pamukkalensis TaxID=1439726 RepID=A0A1E3H000_9HYPH|nr:metallophosphoesterase [Methylobrevis pamukkalensis]ODN69637.1 Calcineurin-like phosphoesterase [Methylobrevis pamukkalensis]